MSPIQPEPSKLEREFAVFWHNFDPRAQYNEHEKLFFRHLWLLMRAFNLIPRS